MRTFLKLSIFAVSCFLHAQDLDRVRPAPVPKLVELMESPAEPDRITQEQLDEMGIKLWATPDEDILLPELKGVRVVGAAEDVDASKVNAENPLVSEVGDPDLQESMRMLLSAYTGKPASEESIERMITALRLLLAQVGYPFSLVYLPPQDVTDGFLHLVLVESRIGSISVEGNHYFSGRNFLSRIPLRVENSLNIKHLTRGVDRINANPFREATARFKKGDEPATVDLILQTRDRLPLRLHGGFNNSGTPTTSEERLSAGVDWGNVFGTGHLASLQWTSDPDAKYSRAVSGNSVIDLPGGRNLVLFGAYSEISGKTEPEFDQEGESWQVGLNLDQTLPSASPAFTHRLTYALDFKSSDNNLDFIQPPFIIPITDNRTHVVQASAAYRGTCADALGSTGFGAKLTLSPGGIGSNNEDEAFQGSRFGADSSYVYGTIDLTRDTRLPRGFTWNVQIQGQLASTNLLGSEAMSGGGMYSVRGYEEGEVIGDNAVMLRQELRFPLLRPASQGFATSIPDALSLFVFQDAAYLWSTDKLEGEKSIDLASLGIGLQYQLGPSMTLRLAYGWQLVESGSSDSGDDSHLHFALTAGF